MYKATLKPYAAARSTGLRISADTSAALRAGVVVRVDEGGSGLHVVLCCVVLCCVVLCCVVLLYL
jgi:hypothetical protein